MEDFSTIFYVILGILYFLFSIFRKKKTPQHPDQLPGDYEAFDEYQDSDSTTTNERRRPVTFEELLQEFAQGKQDRPEVVQEHKPEIKKEMVSEQKPVEVVENKYKNVNTSDLRTIDEIVKTSKSEEKTFRFDVYDTEELKYSKSAHELAKMLKDRDGIRKAILLKEILTPKYF
ncbi:hypothetical protein QQ008_28700 [Fulvivirgaceae bacterium BMA10]|uniref:Uncharacterized protein n=1 Tax=Splendidivirga corallicola TaxID=3051826 RepID=A0ABT8KXA1_9BACT|nr:hypothetical protein [Fulvivirgaceae bacterium BMA10]